MKSKSVCKIQWRLTKFEALEERIEQLEATLKSKNNQINNVLDNMKTLNRSLNKYQKRSVQQLLEKEIYDKKFNTFCARTLRKRDL